MNKTIIYALWSLCFLYPCLLLGQTLSPRIDIDRSDCLQIPKARDSDIAPFTNTIKTYGNGVLELYTPPVGNQGYQGSCTGWAFGYGCASIQDSGNDILKNRENSYTYELWHTMYGLMKIQEIQNANEQVSTTGLPQGVYVVLLKENGTTSAQKKIMVK